MISEALAMAAIQTLQENLQKNLVETSKAKDSPKASPKKNQLPKFNLKAPVQSWLDWSSRSCSKFQRLGHDWHGETESIEYSECYSEMFQGISQCQPPKKRSDFV